MTASAMSGWKRGAARARLSILTHNKVFVEDEGALANQIEDVADLDLDDVHARTTIAGGETDNVMDFMSEISQEEHIWNCQQLPMMTDPFVAFNDFSLADSDNSSFTFSAGIPNANQVGSIEDWFSSIQDVSR